MRKVRNVVGGDRGRLLHDLHSGVRRIVAPSGSAHDEVALAVLTQVARERLKAGQEELD